MMIWAENTHRTRLLSFEYITQYCMISHLSFGVYTHNLFHNTLEPGSARLNKLCVFFNFVNMEAEKPKVKQKTPPTKRKSRAAKLRFLKLHIILYDDSISPLFNVLFNFLAKKKFCWRSTKRRHVMYVLKK